MSAGPESPTSSLSREPIEQGYIDMSEPWGNNSGREHTSDGKLITIGLARPRIFQDATSYPSVYKVSTVL